MAGLDTNVLVRWLITDDPLQTAQVRELLESGRQEGKPFFVPSTVLPELDWVLRSRYGLEQPAMLLTLSALLETQEIDIQCEPALEHALNLYRTGRAEFADCLHAGLCAAAAQASLLIFDAKAARLAQVELIGG